MLDLLPPAPCRPPPVCKHPSIKHPKTYTQTPPANYKYLPFTGQKVCVAENRVTDTTSQDWRWAADRDLPTSPLVREGYQTLFTFPLHLSQFIHHLSSFPRPARQFLVTRFSRRRNRKFILFCLNITNPGKNHLLLSNITHPHTPSGIRKRRNLKAAGQIFEAALVLI